MLGHARPRVTVPGDVGWGAGSERFPKRKV